MKSTRNFTLKLVMGSLLAVCLNAGLANAQAVAGNFTLPFAAHWGQANLSAGNYSFVLERGTDAKLKIIRAGKPVAFVMEQSYSPNPAAKASLTVVRTRSGNTVTALSMPSIGRVLNYAPSKPKRSSSEKERAIAQLTIPITTAVN